jgi:pimeloyl-ACP methyl ester carboxylesterase
VPTPAARDHDPAAAFARAYQDAVDQWPVPVTSHRVPTSYGLTHLLISGGQDTPAVLLLPGSGATATVWRELAAGLSRSHRVIAVDPVGQPGLSTPSGTPTRTASELADWLDQVLDGLAITGVALIGHSYGAWIALRYALQAPDRVSRLVLLDPTDTFAPLSLRYRLRAIPLLARPSTERMRRFLAWETGGCPADPAWLAVVTAGQNLGRARIVLPRRPRRGQLAGLHVPVLVIVAARSQAHDPHRIARRARDRLPDVTTATLGGATHHSIPATDAPGLLHHIEPFLAGEARQAPRPR